MEELTLSAQHLYNLIKLDYEATDVQQQKYFIEHIVDIIATKVGELYPVYRTHPKIPHGSFYQRTKIEQAREFDFLHPFVFSENKGIRIQNKSTFPTSSPDATEVYITPYLKNILSQPKENHNLLQYADYTINKRLNPIPDILETLHKAVSDALIELDSDSECHIVYRGECDLKRSKIEFLEVGETDPHILSLNEVALDANDFGPCITLAIGGPLCISHVDMTFCIEDLKMNSEREWRERYFVLLRYGFLQNNWLRTYYKPGYKELDEHHTKILVLLKKCFVECKKYQYDSTYTSHVLRTLVLSHHQVCKDETSLGRCFYQVAQHVLRMAIHREDNEKLYISSEWLESLKNVSYPVGVSIINATSNLFPTDLLFTLSLYILVQFMRYRDTVDLLCSTKLLSVFIQVICKYSTAALNIRVGGLLNTEVKSYKSDVLKERVHEFLVELRYLRYKGGAINSILSHPPLPYIPYCPDPEQPIRISLTGKIEKICKEEEKGEWEMWRHMIEQNIGLTRFLELRKHQKNIRKWEQIRRQEISHRAKKITRQEETKHQENLIQEEIKRQEYLTRREDIRRWVLRHREEIKHQEELKCQGELKHQEELKRQAELKRQEELARQKEIKRQDDIRNHRASHSSVVECVPKSSLQMRKENIENKNIKINQACKSPTTKMAQSNASCRIVAARTPPMIEFSFTRPDETIHQIYGKKYDITSQGEIKRHENIRQQVIKQQVDIREEEKEHVRQAFALNGPGNISDYQASDNSVVQSVPKPLPKMQKESIENKYVKINQAYRPGRLPTTKMQHSNTRDPTVATSSPTLEFSTATSDRMKRHQLSNPIGWATYYRRVAGVFPFNYPSYSSVVQSTPITVRPSQIQNEQNKLLKLDLPSKPQNKKQSETSVPEVVVEKWSVVEPTLQNSVQVSYNSIVKRASEPQLQIRNETIQNDQLKSKSKTVLKPPAKKSLQSKPSIANINIATQAPFIASTVIPVNGPSYSSVVRGIHNQKCLNAAKKNPERTPNPT